MEYIGISQEGNWFYLAQIKKSRNSIQILNLQSQHQENSTISKDVNPLYTGDSAFSKKIIVTGLNPQEVLIRKLSVQASSPKALKKALHFQAELSTSLSPDETIIEARELSTKDGTSSSLVFTTSHHALKEHLKKFQQLSIDPDIVSCYPIALVRFAQLLHSELSNAFLLHFGMTQTHCVFMKDTMPYASFTISWGLHDFHQALLADAPQEKLEDITSTVDILEAEEQRPRLWKVAQKFGLELSKVFHSFSKEHATGKLPLLLTGLSGSFRKMDLFFLSHLEDLITENITNSPKEKNFPEIRKYALSLGMILDIITQKEQAIQFRQHPFIPKTHLHGFGKKILALTLASFLVAGGAIAFSQSFVKNEKNQLKEKLYTAQVLDAKKMEKPAPSKRLSEPLEQQLAKWDAKITRDANSFPFILQIPSVSAFLSWISQLEIGKIAIQDIHYELTRFPSLENLHEPYEVKVSVEFTSPLAADARKFHDLIVSGKGLIDPQKEISWDILSDRYKASFYLQQKKTQP